MKRRILLGAIGAIATVSVLGMASGLLPALAQDGASAASGTASSKDAMQNMPRLQEKRTIIVKGDENWDEMTGFGKDAGMAEMMTLMMVGGSGMEHMKMGSMKMGNRGMADMKMGGMNQAQGLPITVTLATNPPIVGDNPLDLLVTDASGKPVTGLKLMATVAMTNMDMGTAKPKVTEGKDGHYTVMANFSMKGPWRVMLMTDAKSDKANAAQSALDFNVDGKTKWVAPRPAANQNGGWQVMLNTKPDTLKVGKNILDLTILNPSGKPVTGAKVTGAVEMTNMDMGITHPTAREGKDGHYLAEVDFSMKGPWRVTVTVAPPKQKPFVKAFDFNISP